MQNFLDMLVEMLLWVPKKIFSLILDGLATVLEAIPVPDWAAGVAGASSGITGDVMYFAEPFNVGSGIGILLAAYAIRFLIRRIPVIG